MPYMLMRRPVKRARRTMRKAGPRRPGYRSGVNSRMSQNSNFRIGSRALKPSTAGSQTVSSVFTTTTSGVQRYQIVQTTGGQSVFDAFNASSGTSLRIRTELEKATIICGTSTLDFTFPGAGVFQDLYDFWRIDRVEIIVYVGSTWMGDVDNNQGGVIDVATPVIAFAVDSNDADAVTQDQLLSYANVQMKQAAVNAPIQLSYKPAANADLGNAVNIAGTGPVFSPRIATATPSVQHFGVKMVPMGLSAVSGVTQSLSLVSFVIKQYVTFLDRRGA